MGIPQIANAIQNPGELKKLLVPDAVFIGGIEVDVLSIEEKSQEWEVTQRPVEAGLDISDVRYKLPTRLRIEGWLTDTSLSPESIGTSLLGGGGFSFETWQDKKKALEELADSNEVIEISTRLDVYASVVITFLQVSHDKDTANGYPFVMEARPIRIVSSDIVDVDPSQVPKALQDKETKAQKNNRGKKGPKKNGGKKLTENAADKDVDPLRSLAQGLGFNV